MGIRTYAQSAGFLALWNRALDVEFGIAIPTNNVRWLERNLYEARKTAGDPRLEGVMMMRPGNGEIWLCRKEVDLEEALP